MNQSKSNSAATLAVKPDAEQTLGQYIPLLYHYNMLQDEDRVGAFQKAIDLVVRPGMKVVELGGGTGILSSLAARRGADVTCVERNPELVAKATELIELNGLSDAVEVVQADGRHFTPDDPIDVVICEMLHVGLLRERQAAVIESFKRNHVKRFGKSAMPQFIPEATILMVQLVEQSFDFAGYVAPVPMFQSPVAIQSRTIELSGLSAYSNFAYGHDIPQRFEHRETMTSVQDGYLNAIRLMTQNILAIDEDQQQAITWANQHLVLPIESPTHIDAGTAVELQFGYSEGASVEQFASTLQIKPNPN